MFQKILVPVDGSNTAWKALRTAAALGEKFQGEILVLTVMEPYDAISNMSMNLDRTVLEKTLETMKKASFKVLDTAKDKLKEYGFSGKAEFMEKDGNAAELILKLARKSSVDSIVMGSRGLSGIEEFLLGSVSSKVTQYAEVPVFVVK
jgi:nucleotide-binding universal stress UspA family protein